MTNNRSLFDFDFSDPDPRLAPPEVVWLSLNTSGFNVIRVNGSQLLSADSELHEVFANFKDALYQYREPKTIVLLVLYFLIFILAVLGNILVLIVIFGHRSMLRSTNYFLLNMAISDLLVALICIPVSVAQNVYRAWLFGEFVCKATPYLQGVAVISGILTITALSKDRFLAIRYPILSRRWNHEGCTKASIACVWILSCLLMIPIALVQQLTELRLEPFEPIYYCQESWGSSWAKQTYSVMLLCLIYAVPGCIMVILYTMMGRRLWKSTQEAEQHSEGQSRSGHKLSQTGTDRRRVARMWVIVAFVFAVCWLPYYTFNTILEFRSQKEEDSMFPLTGLYSYALWLGHTNSAVNPVLYCFLGKTFRKKMIRMLKLLCHRKKEGEVSFRWRMQSSQNETVPKSALDMRSLKSRQDDSQAMDIQQQPRCNRRYLVVRRKSSATTDNKTTRWSSQGVQKRKGLNAQGQSESDQQFELTCL